MDSWQNIAAGILLIGIIFLLFPNVKKSLKESPEASTEDWKSFFIPIALVVLFVIFLIMMV